MSVRKTTALGPRNTRSPGDAETTKSVRRDSDRLIRNLPLIFIRLRAIRDKRGKVRDAVVLQSNPAFNRFTKGPRASPVGRPVSEIFPKAIELSSIPWLELFNRTLETRRAVRHRGFASTTGRCIDVTLYRIAGDEFIALASDITEQEKAEAGLRQSETRYRQFIEASQEAVLLFDRDFRLTYVNAKGAKLVGLPARKIIGRPTSDFTFPEDMAGHRRMLGIRRRGHASRYEQRIRRADGGARWVVISAAPVYGPDGAFDGSLAMLTDITELKNAETALRDSEELYRMLFEMESDALYLINADSARIEEVNQAAVDLYGYTRKQFLAMGAEDISPEPEESAKRIRAPGDIVRFPLVWHRKKSGELFPVEISSRFFQRKGVRYVLVAARDISERRRAEGELEAAHGSVRRSEEFLNSIVEQSPHAMWISDDKGTLIRINPAGCALLNITPEEVVGRYNIFDDNIARDAGAMPLIESVYRDGATARFRIDYDTGRVKGLSLRHSVTRNLDVTIFPVKDGTGRITNAIIEHVDVTKTARLEKALQDSERHFRNLVESAPDAIFVETNDRFAYVNAAALALFGARAPGDLIGAPTFDRFHPSFHEIIRSRLRTLEVDRRQVPRLEQIYLRLDGSPVDVEVSAIPFLFEGRQGALAFVRDISERKRIEAALRLSEERHRLLFQHSGVGIAYFDLEGRVLMFNRVALGYVKGKPEAFIGKTIEEVFPGEQGRLYMNHFRDALQRGASATHEDRVTMEGHAYWLRATYGIINDESGAPVGMQIIFEDFTERRAAEEAVVAALREKEILLKEIHHRVKNNLQIVSSLLNHQARLVKDPFVLELFKESQNRIKSMALVHDKLYRSQSLDRINIGEYAESLILYLFQALQIDSRRIAWEKSIQRIDMDINTAISLGLIINELVSNSLKHAFPGERQGKIRIAMAPGEEGMIRLTVRDDGVGIPEGLDIAKTSTLGLQIIAMLTEQLDGTLSVERDNGTVVTIDFHEPHYKPRL